MMPPSPLGGGSGDAVPGRKQTVSRGASDQVEDLKADVERLLLITEALWKIVQEKHRLDDKELLRQITVLDMADGQLNARKERTPPKACPKCHRALSKRRPKCMFCGEPIMYDPFER
jgi:hypothetical protein